MPAAAPQLDTKTRTATLRMSGDVVMPETRQLYGQLKSLCRRRDIKGVVVDFADAGRVDTSALAIVTLMQRSMAKQGKKLELVHLDERQRAALEILPPPEAAEAPPAKPGLFERVGAKMGEIGASSGKLVELIVDVAKESAALVARRKRLPHGALLEQVAKMGADAVWIVGMLGALLGMTLGFQGVILLQKFGAGPYVADMIGLSMVREFGPMMTAIILTGRTGAAIAAELGTMRARTEIDALQAMGVSPTRFLVLPRIYALVLVQPALTLMSIFLGIAGGMLVAGLALHLPPAVFWARLVERVELGDFIHGIGKSFAFAGIISLTGSYLGLQASADASSVGAATTRAVVVGVTCVILIDAVVATVASVGT